MILLLLFIFLSAKFDAIIINSAIYIDDHLPIFIFRFVVVLLISCFDLRLFFSYGLIFVATFDPLLNYFRGLGFWYLGTVAKWDLFFKQHLTLYKILRFSSLTLGVFIYCKN